MAAKKTAKAAPNVTGVWARASATELAAEARRRFKETTTSRFHGVSFYRGRGNWIAYITAGGRRRHLGYFAKEVDAAIAYDKAARKLHGKGAKLNFDPHLAR